MPEAGAFDGNAEQVRTIATEIAEALLSKMDERDKGRTFHTDGALHEWLDKRITDKLKIWAAGLVLAYSIPIIVAAFYIGGMSTQLESALRDQRMNTQSLQARGGWMNDQERFNCEIRRAMLQNHPGEAISDCAFVTGQDRSDSRR